MYFQNIIINLEQFSPIRNHIPQITQFILPNFLKPKNIILIQIQNLLISYTFQWFSILNCTRLPLWNLINNQSNIPTNNQIKLSCISKLKIKTRNNFKLSYYLYCWFFDSFVTSLLLLIDFMGDDELLGDILFGFEVTKHGEFE